MKKKLDTKLSLPPTTPEPTKVGEVRGRGTKPEAGPDQPLPVIQTMGTQTNPSLAQPEREDGGEGERVINNSTAERENCNTDDEKCNDSTACKQDQAQSNSPNKWTALQSFGYVREAEASEYDAFSEAERVETLAPLRDVALGDDELASAMPQSVRNFEAT